MAAEITYHLWRRDQAILPGHPVWNKPLPLTRQAVHHRQEPPHHKSISYGHYFESVKEFLRAERYAGLVKAVIQQTEQRISSEHIRRVAIVAEKHGAFYHPARVTVVLKGETEISFVVNVAVGPADGRALGREYRHLKRLADEDELNFLPRCYHIDRVQNDGQPELAMFVGQWFDGYREFHLSQDSPSSPPVIRVWDDLEGPLVLDPQQARQLYHQAAMILTAFYNPVTYEQIYPWHHAAGDFIVRLDAENLDVKLITVRDYALLFDHPGFEDDARGPEQVLLDGLLLFLLNLVARMRLDRLDGVGPLAWAPDEAVFASVSGFFEGLSLMVRRHGLPGELIQITKEYLSSLEPGDCEALLGGILALYHPEAPELSVLKAHLSDHAGIFCAAVAAAE